MTFLDRYVIGLILGVVVSMRRPTTARARREMAAEARHNAVVLPEDEGLLGETGAWRDMDQSQLPLKDQPIKGLPAADEGSTTKAETVGSVAAAGDDPPAAQVIRELFGMDLEKETTTVAAAPALTTERAKDLGKPFEPQADKFQTAIADLGKRPLTRQTVELAKEYDVEAIKYLKDLEGSELRRQTDSAFQLHRFLTGIVGKLKAPAESLRTTCSGVIYRFQQAERQRIAQEQREREAAIRKQQDEERAAERAALEAAGATEEVAVLDATPLAPVIAPPAREETKIENVSIVTKCKLKRIADPKLFIEKVLAPNPSMLAMLFKTSDSDFSKWLTAQMDKASGQLSIKPEDMGLEIEFVGGTRHRSNGE